MNALRMRPELTVLAVPVVVVALLLTVAWLGQRRLISFPARSSPRVPADARIVELATSDGLRLVAWLVPPTSSDRHTAVLVAHGNAGHRGDRMALARGWAAAGLTVLLLDYRGYGGNPGSPNQAGLARDARAGLAYLHSTGYEPAQTVYFGESLGAAVAAELAAEHAPKGLVLRSPFTDLASMAAQHYPAVPARWLVRDHFNVIDHVARVTVPTTVIYGTADTIVPPQQSRTVAERAAGPVRVIVANGADHNDAVFNGPLVINAVIDVA